MNKKLKIMWTTAIAGFIAVFMWISYLFDARDAITSNMPAHLEIQSTTASALFIAVLLFIVLCTVLTIRESWLQRKIAN